MKKLLIMLCSISVVLSLVGTAFADIPIPITADVGNANPVVGDIQICQTSTCAESLALDPGTAFTVKVDVTDPNGQSDINTGAFRLEVFPTEDSFAQGWDHLLLSEGTVTHGTANGCVETGSTYCLNVSSGDWTTKFIAGLVDVYVVATDNNAEVSDSNTNVGGTSINPVVGHTEDATSGTYTGGAGSTENAILTSEALAYIITTHNGNVDMDLKVTATDLNKVGAGIAVGNQKWNTTNTYGTATPFTGGADVVVTAFARGTDPTSAVQDIYYWLDVPAGQVAGSYTGTITYGSVES